MLIETNITFCGCRIWLDGESKRQLKAAVGKLERWIENQIGDPPKFSTVGAGYKARSQANAARSDRTRESTSGRNPVEAGSLTGATTGSQLAAIEAQARRTAAKPGTPLSPSVLRQLQERDRDRARDVTTPFDQPSGSQACITKSGD